MGHGDPRRRHGVLGPVLDNIVTGYFKDLPLTDIDVLNGVKFADVIGHAAADLLIDFNALDKKIVDDILGIDGSGYLQKQIADLVNTGINNLSTRPSSTRSSSCPAISMR